MNTRNRAVKDINDLIAANEHVNDVCNRTRERVSMWAEDELRLSIDELRQLADDIEKLLDQEVDGDDGSTQELY